MSSTSTERTSFTSGRSIMLSMAVVLGALVIVLLECRYCFKIALWQKRYDDVKKWIKQARICGNVGIG